MTEFIAIVMVFLLCHHYQPKIDTRCVDKGGKVIYIPLYPFNGCTIDLEKK